VQCNFFGLFEGIFPPSEEVIQGKCCRWHLACCD